MPENPDLKIFQTAFCDLGPRKRRYWITDWRVYAPDIDATPAPKHTHMQESFDDAMKVKMLPFPAVIVWCSGTPGAPPRI